MQKAYEEFSDRGYFKGLHGIRCIAILVVVWHHVPHPTSLPVLSRGFLGVDLFFVLSGFLIATLLLREKRKFGRVHLGYFWMRRLLRLTPPYYLMLFALLALYLVLRPGTTETKALTSGFPVYLLYLSNWFPQDVPNLSITWSLATEEQFYLLWPLVIAFLAPRAGVIIWCLALIINQALNFGILDPFLSGTGDRPRLEILEVTFTPILLGVGLAHLMGSFHGYTMTSRVVGFKHAPCVFALILVAISNWPVDDISGLPRVTFHVTATMLIAALVISENCGTVRFLEVKPIVFLGKVSYGVYLYHMIAIHIARGVVEKLGLPEFPGVLVVGLALSVALAALSLHFFERYFLNLRNKFRHTLPDGGGSLGTLRQ